MVKSQSDSLAVPISWKEGDSIAVLDIYGTHLFTSRNSGDRGTFEGMVSKDAGVWYALSPFDVYGLEREDRVSATVPSVQKVSSSGIDPNSHLMAARVLDLGTPVQMKARTSSVRIYLEAEDVVSVTLKGLFGEVLSGNVCIDFSAEDALQPVLESSADSVRVEPLLSHSLPAGVFYFSTIPVVFQRGCYLTLEREDHSVSTLLFPDVKEVEAAQVTDLGRVRTADLNWIPKDELSSELFTPQNRAHCLAFLERYLDLGQQAVEAEGILAAQAEDGSWPEIEYSDPSLGSWQPAKHIDKMVALASAVYEGRGQQYLEGFDRALSFWDTQTPTCRNWWFNQVYVPKTLGPAAILIKDRLSDNQMAKILKIMSKAQIGNWTGQNKVWLSGNVLMTGVLQQDSEKVRMARDSMLEEIIITTGDGIQPDWSFHQHGAQLQLGNYGLSFVSDFSNWFSAWKETPLEVDGEKRDILIDYIYNGPYRVVWKGYFDMNASGRQVDKGRQVLKAEMLRTAMEELGLEERGLEGPYYYSYSDFGVYRNPDWYASVRMQSSRVIGFEMTNNENMRGYFSSDGALLIRRSGSEYEDVSGVWNWRHVPGVTAYDDGTELYGCSVSTPYNPTELVFGEVSGEYMVTAMDLRRDGLVARKAWFFCPRGVVCLGTGISKDGAEVTTAVDQCRLVGDFEHSDRWVRHNGMTYVFLGETDYSIAPLTHRGEWHSILPSYGDEPVEMDLLDIYINHGRSPLAASYAYVVIADGSALEEALTFADNQVVILSNTVDCQSVRIGPVTLSADWVAGEGKITNQ